MRLVIRHKLDEELVSGGDHGGGGDLPAVLPHQLAALVHPVSHLHVIIPEGRETRGGRGSVVKHLSGFGCNFLFFFARRLLLPCYCEVV